MSESDPLITVSTVDIIASMAPLAAIAYVSRILRLDIEWPIIISAIRTFLQLSILAFILDPIFIRGVELWWLVLGYCFLMILLASYEGSIRSKYYVDGQFWMVLLPMMINVTTVALFAFFVIIKPEPRWDPQYAIPIVGMLLGNCINGVSLALNSLFSSLVECSREIELLLSFGANERESTERLVRESIRNGAMPQLNSMAIIGLISIPGMMTGQILGGTSVTQAARYQILIAYFIAMCSFGTILMELQLAVRVCFDSRSMLRTDLFKKREHKPNILFSIKSSCQELLRTFSLKRKSPKTNFSSLTAYADEFTCLSPSGTLSVHTPIHEGRDKGELAMSIDRLRYGFRITRDEESKQKHNDNRSTIRVLFENLSFNLYSGDTALIVGPSGVGKSTLLRIIAGLAEADGERIKVYGRIQNKVASMAAWRRQVRYVPQTKVDIPGTPNDFIRKIGSFDSWKCDKTTLSYFSMESATRELLATWGMNNNLLCSEWKTLSGGESQRILIAITLASSSKNNIILFDESTSALDLKSKVEVEKSIKEFCSKSDCVAIWVSHDPDQKRRLGL